MCVCVYIQDISLYMTKAGYLFVSMYKYMFVCMYVCMYVLATKSATFPSYVGTPIFIMTVWPPPKRKTQVGNTGTEMHRLEVLFTALGSKLDLFYTEKKTIIMKMRTL